jgi:hypothetical protein
MDTKPLKYIRLLKADQINKAFESDLENGWEFRLKKIA